MSAGSSVAGSRLRGHQPPSGTPSAVDVRGNTSRRSCCADVMRRTALCGELPRTDIMSALPPPVSNRLPALSTTPTWTSALDMPPVTAPYSHLSASSAGETAARARVPGQSDQLSPQAKAAPSGASRAGRRSIRPTCSSHSCCWRAQGVGKVAVSGVLSCGDTRPGCRCGHSSGGDHGGYGASRDTRREPCPRPHICRSMLSLIRWAVAAWRGDRRLG
jgi:hypothetical protein